MQSANQTLAEQPADKPEIADLLAADEQLELCLEVVSDGMPGPCPDRPVAMRRSLDEGDEANGAALSH